MPIDRRLVVIPNVNPPAWVLYAHSVLLRAVAQADQTSIANWCVWAGGASFRFFASDERLLSNFCLITDGTCGIGVFEGTRTLSQLIGQIAASSMTTDAGIPASISTFDRIYADAVTTLARDSVSPMLRNAPVLITGHSLGGAIAHVFAARRVDGTFTDVRLLTFGQPRTGDLTLVQATTPNYIRVVNTSDPVAGVPPRPVNIAAMMRGVGPNPTRGSYAHGGNAVLITTDGLIPTTDQETGSDLGAMALGLGAGLQFEEYVLLYHAIGVYASRLYGFAILETGIPDLSPVVAISRTLQGQPIPIPNPANAPIIPPLPTRPEVMAPGFVPVPFPGHLPLQDRGIPVQLIEVPDTFIQSNGASALFGRGLSQMAIVKCTFFYQQRNQGFQEVYYSAGASFSQVQPLVETLGTRLLSFRGQDTGIIGYRLSLVNVPLSFPRIKTSRSFPPLPTWARGGWGIDPALNVEERSSDMFSVCVLMRGVPSTVGLPAKNIFMRGMPDAYDINGGELNGQLYQFFGIQRVQALQNALAGGGVPFGWLGGQNPAPAASFTQFTDVVQNVNGTVTFTLVDLLGTLPAGRNIGLNYFPVSISGLVAPGNLNGTLPVAFESNGLSCTTKKRIAIQAWDNNTGTMTYLPKMFIPFSGNIIQIPREGNPLSYGNIWAVRISERKAGRIQGTVPGRKANRVRA